MLNITSETLDFTGNLKKVPKKYQKKERNKFGFTEKQIQYNIKQRRVVRPPYEKLIELIKSNGYVKTGKIFGV